MIVRSASGRLAVLAMSFATFVLGHDLVFLVTYGERYGSAMRSTGHGPIWVLAALSGMLISVALVLIAWSRLRTLVRAVPPLGRWAPVPSASPARFALGVVRLSIPVLAIALVLFVATENAEHVAAGLPAPGLAVLVGSSQYHLSLPIFLAVGLLVASIGALYRWRRDVLVERANATRSWRDGVPSVSRPRPVLRDRRPASIVGRRLAVRAPPRPGAVSAAR